MYNRSEFHLFIDRNFKIIVLRTVKNKTNPICGY